MAMSSSSPVVLGLGLGDAPARSAFTFLQMQELQHQALIYKYMASGLPVPLHLIIPIWKSVAGCSSSYANHHCPTSTLTGYEGPCFDYRNMMEPEPGRCRRTDGKKWRCSRDVVPDRKYCERHMHRGRHRSRKHVEGAATKPANPATTTIASNGSSSTHLTISIPTGLQLMPTNATIPAPITGSTVNNSSSTGNSNASSTRLGFSLPVFSTVEPPRTIPLDWSALSA